jgi:hypothetical protein
MPPFMKARSALLRQLLRYHTAQECQTSGITSAGVAGCLHRIPGTDAGSPLLLPAITAEPRLLHSQSRSWSTALHVDGSSGKGLTASTAAPSSDQDATADSSSSSSRRDGGVAGAEDDQDTQEQDRPAEELRQQLLQAALGHVVRLPSRCKPAAPPACAQSKAPAVGPADT